MLTALGPGIFVVDHNAGWSFFAISVAAIVACLGLAWYAQRRWPTSEIFAGWLFAAVAIWCGSAWFGALVLAV
jgi:hypothetical protein